MIYLLYLVLLTYSHCCQPSGNVWSLVFFFLGVDLFPCKWSPQLLKFPVSVSVTFLKDTNYHCTSFSAIMAPRKSAAYQLKFVRRNFKAYSSVSDGRKCFEGKLTSPSQTCNNLNLCLQSWNGYEKLGLSVKFFKNCVSFKFSRGSQSYRSSVIPVSMQFLRAAYPKTLKAILVLYLLLNNALLQYMYKTFQ